MKAIKKIHLLPNVITALGLSCGLFVIFKMNMLPMNGATEQVLVATAGILLMGALADLLDGAVARAMKAESDFGGLFDSLADAITFGVAPSIVILKTLSIPPGHDLWFLSTTSAMVFSVCGVLRLVRFSVRANLIKGDADALAADKKNFTGLPIPAAASAAVSGNLLLASKEFQQLLPISFETRAWFLIAMLFVLGYFMISRWKFPSLKTLHIRVGSFEVVFLTVVFAVLLFYGIINYFPFVFFALSWAYLLAAWILSIIRLVSGRQSKTLEDFEPEDDEFEDE